MSKPAKALYTKDFLLATIASVFVGGYSILLLTLTLMYGNDAGFTAAAAGLLSSVFAFASLGMRPFSGLLCDRFPKKRLLILSAVGYTVLPLLFLAELPYGVLLGARIAQGFCMGVASTAVAAIATSFIPKSHFTEGVSIFGVGMSACSAVAPGIGLWILAHFGYTGVFLYSSFTGLLIIALVLPIRCRETTEKPQSKACLGELLRGLYEPTALYSAACTLFLAVIVSIMEDIGAPCGAALVPIFCGLFFWKEKMNAKGTLTTIVVAVVATLGYWLLGSPLGISHFLFGLICSTITMFVANSIFYKKGEDKAA